MTYELAPGIETLESLPVVYARSIRAVILADLHLGFEEEAARQGFYVPRAQLMRALEVLRRALDETGADWVIFAGDVKHSFSRLLPSERRELREVFEYLKKRSVKTSIVRGNHDSYLRLVARDYDVEVLDELFAGNMLVIHGHKKPRGEYKGVKAIIIGHEHPSLRLRDKLGFIAKLPAFLTAPYPQYNTVLVVLPAVGQYQTGTTVSLSPDTYLSPILREDIPLHEIKPYVLAEELGILEFPELGLLEDLLDSVVL